MWSRQATEAWLPTRQCERARPYTPAPNAPRCIPCPDRCLARHGPGPRPVANRGYGSVANCRRTALRACVPNAQCTSLMLVGVGVPTRYWLPWGKVRRDEFIGGRGMRGSWGGAVMSVGGWEVGEVSLQLGWSHYVCGRLGKIAWRRYSSCHA